MGSILGFLLKVSLVSLASLVIPMVLIDLASDVLIIGAIIIAIVLLAIVC